MNTIMPHQDSAGAANASGDNATRNSTGSPPRFSGGNSRQPHLRPWARRPSLHAALLLLLWSASQAAVTAAPCDLFQDRVPYDVGQFPYSMAAGDLNGDRQTDLVVGNIFSASVSVLLGNGDGTFQRATDFDAGRYPSSVALGDFNEDRQLDLVVANNLAGTVSVHLGNGDGTFKDGVPYDTDEGPISVAVSDFNGDHHLDLAVVNFSSDTVVVLLGNGDGTFQDAVSYGVGETPESVAVGDFNGDKQPDLAVVNFTSDTVSVLLGNADGSFKAAIHIGAGKGPAAVTVGDFNGDTHADLAVANVVARTVSVLLGNGNGTFQAATPFGAGRGEPYSLVVGDFNGDNLPDLATANSCSITSVVCGASAAVLLGQGDGTFLEGMPYYAGEDSQFVVTDDFNGDGQPDLAVANTVPNTVSVLLGRPCNEPPVAVCQDVTVSAGRQCNADASIDDGSFDPDGDGFDLTQDPAGPYALGETEVTLTITDNYGASDSCTATVTVVDRTPPLVLCPPDLTLNCDQPTDPDHTGTAQAVDDCDPAPSLNWEDAETPGPGPLMKTITRTWFATDASANPAWCDQTITVLLEEEPVECHFVVGPLLKVTPFVTQNLVLACDNQSALVVLDASLSSGATDGQMTYQWYVDGQLVGDSPILTTDMPVGAHQVTLVLQTTQEPRTATGCTGGGAAHCSQAVTVLDGGEAVEQIVQLLQLAPVPAKNKSQLVDSLRAASLKLMRGDCTSGVNGLHTFQNKIQSQLKGVNPAVVDLLDNAAQAVIDAYQPCDCGSSGK